MATRNPKQGKHAAGPGKSAPQPRSSAAILRFIVIFAAVSTAGIGLEYYLMQSNGARGYREFVASTGNWLPVAVGIDSKVTGTRIVVNRRNLEVTPECSGLEAMGIFCAGVIAFPCGRRKTLIGLGIGLVGVGVLNILRVSILTIFANASAGAFHHAHEALTHLFPLFAVLPLWLCWLVVAFRTGSRGKSVTSEPAEQTTAKAQPAKYAPLISLMRFGLRAIGFTLIAWIVWKLTSPWTAAASLEMARILHAMIGRPAPYLIVEVLTFDYFWLAPPIQLFVGLTLASTWLTWKQRAIASVAGVLMLWFIVVMGVIAVASPYLGPTTARSFLSTAITKGHLVITPAIFWLILVGMPSTSSKTKNADQVTRPRRWLLRLLLGGSICLLIPLLFAIIESTAPRALKDARAQLAASLRSNDLPASIKATLALGAVQERHTRRHDQRIWYLAGRLCMQDAEESTDKSERRKKISVARRCLSHESITPKAKSAMWKKLAKFRP